MLYFFKFYFLLGWFFLGLFFCKPATAQTLPEKLNNFLKEHGSKRLALVTNKSFYQAGDTVYFRVSSGQNTSENLMEVQLLSPETDKTVTTKILLKDGVIISYIILPDNAVSGDYILRAFDTVGWETSELLRVYNLNQPNTLYKTSNWFKADNSENLRVIKNINNWEIEWHLPEKAANTKGWFFITNFFQVNYSQQIDFSAVTGKITVPVEAIAGSQVQLLLAKESGEIIQNYTLFASESNKNFFQLKLNKNIFTCREQVNLALSTNYSSNNLANQLVAVRVLEQWDSLATNLITGDPLTEPFYLQRTLPIFNLKKILATNSVAPEDYIFVLKGQIVSITDKKPIGSSLIHLIVPATNQLEVLYSDKDGRIQLELDPFEGTKPMVFRAIQEGVELRNLQFIPDSTQNRVPWLLTYTTSAYTPAQQALIAKYKVLNRIEQAFYQNNEREITNANNYFRPTQFEENKLKPTTSYDLLAYEKFSNVAEIFRELIPAIEVIKRKDGVHARLYARLQKRFYTYYPLFLIDGIPSYDVETILNLPANQIVKIDVFNTSAALIPFDALSTGGVIALYTKERHFNPAALHDNLITVTGTAASVTLPKIIKPEPMVPDFRSLVFWNPVLKTDSNGSVNLSFTTTDQIGRFAIEVTTTTPEGEVKTTTTHYTVEPQK